MGRPVVEFLLDSVILIDHFNDISPATTYLREVEDNAAISVVTRAEVLTGFDADSREEKELLDEFPLLEITKPVADLTAILRREHGWKVAPGPPGRRRADHDLKLATRNTRDFPPARHGFVVVPYALETDG